MAKETCAICGKMVGMATRIRLGDGNYICADCYRLAGYGMLTKNSDLTLDQVHHDMATDPTSIARQEKDAYKSRVQLDKFGLDFDNYSLDDLHARNIKSVKEISASLAGSKLYSFGSLLSGDANQTFLMEMERAQVEQNMILIRQNEEIIRLLEIVYGEMVNNR